VDELSPRVVWTFGGEENKGKSIDTGRGSNLLRFGKRTNTPSAAIYKEKEKPVIGSAKILTTSKRYVGMTRVWKGTPNIRVSNPRPGVLSDQAKEDTGGLAFPLGCAWLLARLRRNNFYMLLLSQYPRDR